MSPLHDENQSNITIMFNSTGVGVNVECEFGMMHVRTSAPYSMFVSLTILIIHSSLSAWSIVLFNFLASIS